MIGTIEIKVNAARPNLPLSPMFAFKDSPSSLRIMEVPKKIVDWNITEVNAVVHYPDNTTNTFPATRLGNVWVVTFNGCSITGKVVNGLEITANGTDENENAVNGYVLGVGDIYILDRDADIEEAVSKHTMRYCEVMPETPVAGDVFIGSGALEIYDGTQWISIDIDLSEYATKSEVETTASTLDGKIDSTKTELESSIAEVASDIPTATSELTNDSGFITSASVPTKTSELTNDSGYITSTQVKPLEQTLGWARRAQGSIFLFSRLNNGLQPDENHFVTIDYINDKVIHAGLTYYPWELSMLDGTTFDPPIELTYNAYVERIAYKVNRRIRYINIYGACWCGIYNIDANNQRPYYIKAVENSQGRIVPDTNFYIVETAYPITFDQYERSITTIEGIEGGITCTRQSVNTYYTSYKPIAYEDQLPTKVSDLTNDAGYLTTVSWNDVQDKPSIPTKTSDLTNDSDFTTNAALNSGLALKQDTLTSAQLSNIERVPYIDPANTIVTFDDDSVGVYNVVGELTQAIKQEWERLAGAYVKDIKIGTNVNALGNSVFYRAYSNFLTSVTIPNSVTSIGDGAFSGCGGLTSVVIPNSVTSINGSMFQNCTSLSSVTIPNSVTSIGDFAFRSCTSLSSVSIPESTTNIGGNAFRQSGITNITIPNSISSIGTNAFYDCTNLTSLTFKGKTLAEVQAMSNYPWGISDTSIIKTWNDASQEWVLEQIAALRAELQGGN